MKLLTAIGDFCVNVVFFFGMVLDLWSQPEFDHADEYEDEPPPE